VKRDGSILGLACASSPIWGPTAYVHRIGSLADQPSDRRAYKIPAIRVEVWGVFTNKPPPGPTVALEAPKRRFARNARSI
jgi:hypothetical protein